MKTLQKSNSEVSIIICAHNEQEYVGKCLSSVVNALRNIEGKIVFVADRCTDNTAKIAEKLGMSNIIEKKWKKWKNSYAEALQTGYLKTTGKYVAIIDADIVVPADFFDKLIPMLNNNVASVSAQVVTYPHTFLNRLIYAWEQTYELAPLGRKPRGAARVILKQVLDEIGGFNDVMAPDTDLDIRFAKKEYKSVYSHAVKVWHIRNLTIDKMIKGQVVAGRARYALGTSIVKTIAHAIFRLRPFIIAGWLIEWLNKSESRRGCVVNV
jgi:glycosyltransferase involved in cell wall biosynthesis